MSGISLTRKTNGSVLLSTATRSYPFTPESVSEGHPDKLADRISDAILDRFLDRDPRTKVA